VGKLPSNQSNFYKLDKQKAFLPFNLQQGIEQTETFLGDLELALS